MRRFPPDMFDDFEDGNPAPETLTASIYVALASDVTLTDMITSFNAESAQDPSPAIFTAKLPEGAIAPFILLVGEISQEAVLDDNGEGRGREVLYDIACYTNETGSLAEVIQISERVRSVLHRRPLLISGKTHINTIISGPIVSDDIDLYGRTLTARILFDE